jgi:2-polyprenyl-6-methoxyphenol hydroxylase-like FAD-dependent oxidoreductase
MNDTQVLLIGAGPTGLVLALYLTELGITVRILDQAAEPGATSRALVVHARTLEFYRWLGIADEVVAKGHVAQRIHLWVGSRKIRSIDVGNVGAGLSPFPYLLFLTQDEHERLLIKKLAELGVSVERKKKFLDFQEHAQGISATVENAEGGKDELKAGYIVGCDGARSRMREILHTGFAGSTYSSVFYVADTEASGPAVNGDLNIALDEADFLAVFPMKGAGRVRLIGTVEIPADGSGKELEWKDVNHAAMENLQVKVEKVNWFSTYRVHHRVTEHYRKGRAFLAGDAAHIHSPVGGQGMNTGIGDAVNLAWKLAMVITGKAPSSLLDTYESERMAFAKRLVNTTDQAFKFVTANGVIARFMRIQVAPVVIPLMFRFRFMRLFLFRTVSQIAIQYRGSKLSEGHACALVAGDRIPWVKFGDGTDNYSGLNGRDWCLQVYRKANAELSELCQRNGILLQAFPWELSCAKAGLVQPALYLLRPDGYLAFASDASDLGALERYLAAQAISQRLA